MIGWCSVAMMDVRWRNARGGCALRDRLALSRRSRNFSRRSAFSISWAASRAPPGCLSSIQSGCSNGIGTSVLVVYLGLSRLVANRWPPGANASYVRIGQQ